MTEVIIALGLAAVGHGYSNPNYMQIDGYIILVLPCCKTETASECFYKFTKIFNSEDILVPIGTYVYY